MTRRKGALVAAGIAAGLAIIAVGTLLVLTQTDWGRERVRRLALAQLRGMAHGRVYIGHVAGNLLGGARLSEVSITDSAGNPFISVDTIDATYGIGSILRKHISLSNVRLVRPVIVLDRQPGGKWNWDRIFPRDTVQHPPSGPGFGSWITLTGVTVVDGRVTFRAPWTPADTLSPAARDSVIRYMLGPTGRQRIVRVPGGFQRVSDFRDIFATLPLLRLADPKDPRQIIDVDSLRMTAEPMRPPTFRVTDAHGRFMILNDSLFFDGARARLAGSRVSGSGRYRFSNDDLRLRLHAATMSTNDLLWIDPSIPADGTGKMDFALDWVGPVSDYLATNASLAVSGATMTGSLGVTVTDTFAFHDTDVRFDRLDTRTIEQLFPSLRSPRRGYLTGRMAARGGFGAMQVDGDVAFFDPRTGRSRIVARGVVGGTRGALVARDLHLVLAPVRVALLRALYPSLPFDGVLAGATVLDGSTATRLSARGDVTHRGRAGRSRVAGSLTYARRTIPLIDAHLRLMPLSLATVGELVPAAGLVGTVRGPVTLRGSPRALGLRTALTTPDGGSLRASGTFDIASRTRGYDLTAGADLFDARAVTTRLPHTSLTADLTLAGRGTDPAALVARGAMNLRASQYDSVSIDSAALRFTAGGGVVTIDTLAIRVPRGRADAGGSFGLVPGRSGELRYTATVDSLGALARLLPPADTGVVPPRPGILRQRVARARADSARIATATEIERAVTGRKLPKISVDTPRAVARRALAGSVALSGTARGNVRTFDAAGRVRAENLVAYGSSARLLDGTYSWQNARTPVSRVAASVHGIGVSASGFLLDTVAARMSYRKPEGTVDVAVRPDSQRVYTAAARYILDRAGNTLLVDSLRLRFDTTVYASARPSTIHWGPRGIDVDSLTLRTRAGRGVFVDGRIPTSGAADLHLVVTQFAVGDIVALAQSDVPAQGLVSLDMRVRGTRAAPELNGAFGLERFTYAGRPTPELHGTASYAGETLRLAMQGSREGGAPLLFTRGTVPVNLALTSVAGSRVPRNRQIDLTINSDSLPLDLLPEISTTVTDLAGRALAHFHVGGTIERPDVTGRLALWNGTAHIVPLGITPTDIAGTVRLQRDTVVIDSIVARSGGPVRLTGGLGLARSLTRPSFDLRLVARNARIVDTRDNGMLRASADITMRGPFDNVNVDGRAEILRGVLYIPQPTGKTLVGAGDPALFSVLDTAVASQRELFPAQSPFLANLRMNLALDVDRDVFVRSPEANVELYSDGPLRITVDRPRQSIVVDGVLLSDRGEYRFQGRRFQITRGSATFINTPELNPTLQVTGEYQVQLPAREAFNIQIIISGTMRQPKIALQSDAQPPISQTDLLSYLAFGQSSTSLLQQEGSSVVAGGTGSGNLVGAGAAFAARQISAAALGALTDRAAGDAARSLGADVFTISPADVSLDAGSFLRGTQIEFGKYVQTRTFLSLQLRPDPVSLQRPGFTLTHRFPGSGGYSMKATLGPRYLLRQPSLSPNQQPQTTSSFGLFLVREWRY